MAEENPALEVLYAPDTSATATARWGSRVGAALFVLGILFIVYRVVGGWLFGLVSLLLTFGLLALPAMVRRRTRVLRPRRVVADTTARRVRVEAAEGVTELGYDEVLSVRADAEPLGGGLSLDVVRLEREGHPAVVFAAMDAASAKGAAKALRAVLGQADPPEPETPVL